MEVDLVFWFEEVEDEDFELEEVEGEDDELEDGDLADDVEGVVVEDGDFWVSDEDLEFELEEVVGDLFEEVELDWGASRKSILSSIIKKSLAPPKRN